MTLKKRIDKNGCGGSHLEQIKKHDEIELVLAPGVLRVNLMHFILRNLKYDTC
jgi:hypothetical protein